MTVEQVAPLQELGWRGLIAQSTDEQALAGAFAKGPVTFYAGFDPTADSLHAGHLMLLLTARRLQRLGHRPVLLAGGATGLIGDPREVGERQLADEALVRERVERLKPQLTKFVEFDDSPTGAVLANNLDWTGQLSALDFLRDIGKHFSVNVMLARETIRKRLDGDGLSYTEFSYLLLQSNDYLQLHRKFGATLQLGGSDQWGNIVGGAELIRRIDGAHVHALTTPLVTSSDGVKLGKSTGGGSIWLDPEKTSPYAWYQYFLAVQDSDVGKYLRWFTDLDQAEAEELDEATAQRPHQRLAQRRLAQELTTIVHGAEELRRVEAASQALFGSGELKDLEPAALGQALAETPLAQVVPDGATSIVDLLVATGLCESRNAARRTVQEGGAWVNNQRVADAEWQPCEDDWLHGRWLVLRRGKRNFAGVSRLVG
ncbi:tyrosyl-tRNA synthetase [Segniliparus rotundus DSM 44985]|uniref:Tyrosine--tRNA ligase n=1 Tax=Segniliparus rotundus (strain ATCC BAA-972 / CDC 1076 / CIP 108378 / DSM 44985 / JCM 13578) TaxID=640132 RepID=D6Z7U2_SEGRD|nr:tyrosine--tRNA ligase [Segniliparus rotundus]ADG98022.1 tyrosyl-tRNA synthetase [Segniliparus rotundus DSM 44985]